MQGRVEELACTRIVIAHRLSTVARADLIVVVDNGAIVEQGTHEELLGMRNAYYRLVVAQLLRGKPSEDEPTIVRGNNR